MYITDILEKIGDIGRENNIFGDCYVSLSGVDGSDGNYSINGAILNSSSLPELGDLSHTNFSYGILCRYAGETGNNKSLPTTHWNDYNWNFNFNGESSIKKELPKLNFGWYVFRTYIERNGFTKYCDFYLYFCPNIDDIPSYYLRNVSCIYSGDSKVGVSFECEFEPLNHGGILYQGLILETKDGEKIVSFGRNEGAGTNTIKVSEEFYKEIFENLDYNNYTAELKICAKYWYVPRWNNNTFYKDLEPKTIVYNQEPSIIFKSASILGTTVTGTDSDDYGEITYYQTDYQFECEIKGAFWGSTIQYQIYSSDWNNYWDSQTINSDGTYTMTGKLTYSSRSSMGHSSYYQMYLDNGQTIKSSNGLSFGGTPGSPTVSISGSTRSVMHMSTPSNNTRQKQSINKQGTMSKN